MWNLIHRRSGGSRPTSRLAQNSGTLCNRVGIEQAAMAEPEVEAAWRAELERIARLDVKNEEGYKPQIPRSSKNSAAAFYYAAVNSTLWKATIAHASRNRVSASRRHGLSRGRSKVVNVTSCQPEAQYQPGHHVCASQMQPAPARPPIP
jgi:phage FluMu gp28-like protein